jgi:hypothetical protein
MQSDMVGLSNQWERNRQDKVEYYKHLFLLRQGTLLLHLKDFVKLCVQKFEFHLHMLPNMLKKESNLKQRNLLDMAGHYMFLSLSIE